MPLVQVETVITTVKDPDLDGKFVEMDVSVAFPLTVTRRRYRAPVLGSIWYPVNGLGGLVPDEALWLPPVVLYH